MPHPPKVSVSVLTYNLQSYIAQCLNSILDQHVDFRFEIIVSDDHSTDNTVSILQQYAKQHPDIIRLNLRNKNIGQVNNYLDTIKLCKGDYIAHIDGDDYMLPGKLQKLSDYLDQHKDCVLAHHRVKIIDENNNLIKLSSTRKATRGDINALAAGNGIVNSAKMFRRNALTTQSFDVPKYNIGHDWFFDLRVVGSGRICYLTDILGAYRVHATSLMRKTSFYHVARSELYVINSSANLKHISDKSIRKARSIYYATLSRHFYKRNKPERAWILLKASLREHHFNNYQLKLMLKFINKLF